MGREGQSIRKQSQEDKVHLLTKESILTGEPQG